MGNATLKIAVLVLAAGASTRMGRIKQLLPWKGTTLLGHALSQATEICDHVFVVFGAHKDRIAPHLKEVNGIYNEHWDAGMGMSLAVGISHIRNKGHFDAVLVHLADQPLLDAEYLKKLLDGFKEGRARLVATSYGTRVGVPAIFDKTLFKDLEELDKDYGARKLMKNHQDEMLIVDPKGAAIDIDTMESYLELFEKYGK